MTRDEAIRKISEAIARQEGWYVTLDEAVARNIAWPTQAQISCNPGNLRSWAAKDGKPYPTKAGYVDFAVWENVPGCDFLSHQNRAVAEGWRCLRVQVANMIDMGLSLREMFAGKPGVYPGYAPSKDKNDPQRYAENVAAWTGLPIDAPVKSLIEGGKK